MYRMFEAPSACPLMSDRGPHNHLCGIGRRSKDWFQLIQECLCSSADDAAACGCRGHHGSTVGGVDLWVGSELPGWPGVAVGQHRAGIFRIYALRWVMHVTACSPWICAAAMQRHWPVRLHRGLSCGGCLGEPGL